MGLKRTQGQKRNCKKGTRKQQNKRTGKRKTAKKNLRRKRQTKRRLKGGAGLGQKRQKREAENGPNVGKINDSSPPGKIRKNDQNDQNKYLVRGAEGQKNYYLSETNYYSSGSDSEGNSNDEEPFVRRDAMRPMVTPKREEGNKYDNTRGPAQLGYDEIQRAINFQENVNSGLYRREELEKKYKRT